MSELEDRILAATKKLAPAVRELATSEEKVITLSALAGLLGRYIGMLEPSYRPKAMEIVSLAINDSIPLGQHDLESGSGRRAN